jgi:hypothetical protein
MKVTDGLPMAWGVSNVGLENILKGLLNSLFNFFFNLRCPDGEGFPDCILVGFDAWVDAVYGQSLVPFFFGCCIQEKIFLFLPSFLQFPLEAVWL